MRKEFIQFHTLPFSPANRLQTVLNVFCRNSALQWVSARPLEWNGGAVSVSVGEYSLLMLCVSLYARRGWGARRGKKWTVFITKWAKQLERDMRKKNLVSLLTAKQGLQRKTKAASVRMEWARDPMSSARQAPQQVVQLPLGLCEPHKVSETGRIWTLVQSAHSYITCSSHALNLGSVWLFFKRKWCSLCFFKTSVWFLLPRANRQASARRVSNRAGALRPTRQRLMLAKTLRAGGLEKRLTAQQHLNCTAFPPSLSMSDGNLL